MVFSESCTRVLLQPQALLSPFRLCLGVIFVLHTNSVIDIGIVFLLLWSKTVDCYSGHAARTVLLAQFAEYTNFPFGNTGDVAVVVILALVPAMGKNHISFFQRFSRETS